MKAALQPLPLVASVDLGTKEILRQLAKTHRYLAELKGAAALIPNESILIDTLSLQEAKDSSEIENIITTEDELFQADAVSGQYSNPATKEVHNYVAALKVGFARVRQQQFIRLDDILAVQATLEGNLAGLRKLPGTVLRNQGTGKIVYEPPQNAVEIERLMDNFVTHLNRSEPGDPDPLVMMSVLHYQFESIHPFYDGNGRTGRILNLLYLVLHGLLDLPVLYLSRYIVHNKADYYRGIQAVRESQSWESWVLYMLRGVEETAKETMQRVREIRALMQETKERLRRDLPKLYSQDLLNNLFRHPYTKIEFIERDLGVSRPTAIKYLKALVEKGLLKKTKLGRTNFYINEPLFAILSR